MYVIYCIHKRSVTQKVLSINKFAKQKSEGHSANRVVSELDLMVVSTLCYGLFHFFFS